MEIDVSFNPFPGLRPFAPEEDFLFFGREGQSDDLIRLLQRTRFVAVVGTSSSGKSSLVRAGLLPVLYGGFMTKAGSGWRVASMRPGSDPFYALASALDQPSVLGTDGGLEGSWDGLIQGTTMTEMILRRSALGLVHVVQEVGLPTTENLLVLVDQFEELFRFQNRVDKPRISEDAAAFVNLLLEASRSDDFAIYVVLTMRSDFLGDCAHFRGLPEAINEGQYLVPRLTRDQYRRTIEGPVAVGGAKITQRLVQRLLNDLGDDPDQLPILQHALMRTWDYKQYQSVQSEPLDIYHYESIGGMSNGLSHHADEIFSELSDKQRRIAEKLFKRLTGKGVDNREYRWPTQLAELCAVIGATEDEVVSVVDAFRQPSASFLFPPASTPILSNTIIDITHESLIRVWERLRDWVEEESDSADMYRRLAEQAVLYEQARAGLWRDPELQLTLEWFEIQQPNGAWAMRYDPNFETALAFLHKSRGKRGRSSTDRELRRLRILLFTLVVLLLLVSGVAFYTFRQWYMCNVSG